VISPLTAGLTEDHRKRYSDCYTNSGASPSNGPHGQPSQRVEGQGKECDDQHCNERLPLSPEVIELATRLAALPPDAIAALLALCTANDRR